MDDEEVGKLAALCRQLGAEEGQATTMARQLIKRSEQLADERKIDRLEALDYLLKILVEGRQGRVHEEPPPSNRHNQAE